MGVGTGAEYFAGKLIKHLDATEDLLCGVVCDNFSEYYNGEPIGNRVY